MRDAIKKYKAKLKGEGGFTLIELMAVLAILALIAIIAVPAIGSILQKAGDGADDSTIAMIEKSAGIAYVAEGGTVKAAGLKPITVDAPEDADSANLMYTTKYLSDEGYLDYDGEITGEAVLLKSGGFKFVAK